MLLELCREEGFRSMKSDALQDQSSLRNVSSATEYASEDLILFARNPALFIVLNPARNSTVSIGVPAALNLIIPCSSLQGSEKTPRRTTAGPEGQKAVDSP